MEMTLSDAARKIGKGKSTLLRAVKSGKLTARRTDDGTFLVDASELARVYPVVRMERLTDAPDAIHDAPRLTADAGGVELAILRTKVAMLEDQLTRERETYRDTVEDLRSTLKAEQEERRNLQRQLMPPAPQQPTESPSVASAVVGPVRSLNGLLSRLWSR